MVELVKASGTMENKDTSNFQGCERLFVDSQGSKELCTCSLHSHFVAPWRCIPCVLVEEAKIFASQQKCTMTYKPDDAKVLLGRDFAYHRASI